MWNPGFKFIESCSARIYGVHRSLCIRSVRYRGTHNQPGLVFGLDHGGSCAGMGYRIEPVKQREVADYLQEREMLNDIYIPSMRKIHLADGRRVEALAFVVKQHHSSYVKDLSLHERAEIVANAKGQRGPNIDYVLSTLNTLQSIGIRDRDLHKLGELAAVQSKKNMRAQS